LYVGYVDDEETPEMIMKKFETLDKMLAASQRGMFKEPKPTQPKKGKPKRDKDDYAYERPSTPNPVPESEPLGPDQPLNEHQLALLFKMTSSFNVPSDGFIDTAFDGYYEPNDFEWSDEEKYGHFVIPSGKQALLANLADCRSGGHFAIPFKTDLYCSGVFFWFFFFW
jgi:hypothetical protein